MASLLFEENVMKKIFIYIAELVTVILAIITAYRLGYCNACDKYIGASECKPTRRLHFFEI